MAYTLEAHAEAVAALELAITVEEAAVYAARNTECEDFFGIEYAICVAAEEAVIEATRRLFEITDLAP